MKFKVSIGDQIEVPVHLKIRDGGKLSEFKFHVTGKRLSTQEVQDKIKGDGDQADITVSDFLAQNITGWRNQKLVIDEDSGNPAEFSQEALQAMLGVAGVAGVIYLAYLKELVASDGAEGRRKN